MVLLKSVAGSFSFTKKACYFAYFSMSSVFSLPPLLFITFHEMYGISYTLLGTLVLINFCTQLAIDLVFTFFSRFFNIKLTVRLMPLLTSAGLMIYALIPMFFPRYAYAGLVSGTVIFSVASGLCEVLLSPTIAAIPSDDPGKDMSKLHSLYAWGVVSVVFVSTLFLTVFGRENWMYLTFFWASLPIVCFFLFSFAPMPDTALDHDGNADKLKRRSTVLFLCVLCIFFGSAAENAMTNWISAYMENALGIPKSWCDIAGMALFAVLLGSVRSIYAKYGKNIYSVLFLGMAGAAVCYITAGLSSDAVIATVACVMTGIFTSMLWPGTLIFMEELSPASGIAAYALLAAGGDFGASVAPQMLGMITDRISESDWAAELGNAFSLTPDQIGMKAGMLAAAVFPLLGTAVLIIAGSLFKKKLFRNETE